MRLKHSLTLCLASCAMALLSACVVAPQTSEPVVVYAPPPHQAHEEIRRCRFDNQRAHAQVLESYERARSTGRIDPAEAQQFSAMDGRLRNMHAQLARDGLSLQECQYIQGEIGRMRADVLRMSRRDPALARCLADAHWEHQDVLNAYENARRAGQISPGEAQRVAFMETRLQAMRSELARDGLSLQDCQRIAGAIAREREEVVRMSRQVPGVARCMADNRRAHAAVYDLYNEGVRTGRIAAREAQQFRQIDERLRSYQESIRRDGVSQDECQRLSRAIALERAAVERMSR